MMEDGDYVGENENVAVDRKRAREDEEDDDDDGDSIYFDSEEPSDGILDDSCAIDRLDRVSNDVNDNNNVPEYFEEQIYGYIPTPIRRHHRVASKVRPKSNRLQREFDETFRMTFVPLSDDIPVTRRPRDRVVDRAVVEVNNSYMKRFGRAHPLHLIKMDKTLRFSLAVEGMVYLCRNGWLAEYAKFLRGSSGTRFTDPLYIPDGTSARILANYFYRHYTSRDVNVALLYIDVCATLDRAPLPEILCPERGYLASLPPDQWDASVLEAILENPACMSANGVRLLLTRMVGRWDARNLNWDRVYDFLTPYIPLGSAGLFSDIMRSNRDPGFGHRLALEHGDLLAIFLNTSDVVGLKNPGALDAILSNLRAMSEKRAEHVFRLLSVCSEEAMVWVVLDLQDYDPKTWAMVDDIFFGMIKIPSPRVVFAYMKVGRPSRWTDEFLMAIAVENGEGLDFVGVLNAFGVGKNNPVIERYLNTAQITDPETIAALYSYGYINYGPDQWRDLIVDRWFIWNTRTHRYFSKEKKERVMTILMLFLRIVQTYGYVGFNRDIRMKILFEVMV